jgi:hypothetical protein
MKKIQILSILALAGTSAAMAAPQETADLLAAFQVANPTATAIPVVGRQGNAANATVTVPFTGGAYTLSYLSISGLANTVATGSFLREATIQVTPPSGTPFLISAYDQGTSVTTATAPSATNYTIPIGTPAVTGNWTFTFFETFDDATGTAVDSQFTALSVTLNDGPLPTTPTALTGALAKQYTQVPVNGAGTTVNPALWSATETFPSGTAVASVRFTANVTSQNADPAANIFGTIPNNIRVRVVPPTGTTPLPGVPFTTAALSSGLGDAVISLPTTIDSGAGNWRFEAFTNADTSSLQDAVLPELNVQLRPVVAPTATPITLVDGSFVNATATVNSGGAPRVTWFTFTLPAGIAASNNGALDINSEGSTTSPVTDTSMALYGPTGAVVASDTFEGSGSLGLLTFGRGTRQGPTGADGNYNGRDGATLAAGQYYLAVVPGTTPTYGGAFSVTGGSATATATPLNVNVRYISNFVPTPPPFDDLGTLVANVPATRSGLAMTAGQTRWFSFTLGEALTPFNNKALEIDTEGTTTSTATPDGTIAIWNSTGSSFLTDTGDGSDSLGAFSFGLDDRPAPSGTALSFDGRDGYLAAGTYYVAATVGASSTGFDTGFIANNTNTATGTLALRVELKDPGFVTPAVPPAAENLGTVVVTPPATTVLITDSEAFTVATATKWYTFTTTKDVSAANGRYLDIDTEGSTAVGDSEIGLWTPAGGLIATDDDSASGLLSQLSFGKNDGARPLNTTGANLAGTAANGQNGALSAGTYYLGVVQFNAIFGQKFSSVTNATSTANTFVTNLRSNIPLACNAADVGSQGGVAGADGLLDNNDFAAFITLFFNSDPAADVGGQGGVIGADTLFDNNDFAAFITIFFTGCN